MTTDKSLSDVFNIDVTEKVKTGTTTELVIKDGVAEPVVDQLEVDFEQSRKNLQLLLMQGEDALMGALEVAKASEHPRAFEVVGTLIKQMADVNQQLLDLHQQKQKIEGATEGGSSKKQVTNNNAIFVGSTSDLSKMIKKMTGE